MEFGDLEMNGSSASGDQKAIEEHYEKMALFKEVSNKHAGRYEHAIIQQ